MKLNLSGSINSFDSVKRNKSWCLLDLALSVAGGEPWWGRPCSRLPVVYLNFDEEPDCFTVTSILRNLPQVPEFVVGWEFPLMRLSRDLNPDALRRPQAKNKVCSDKQFVEKLLTEEPTTRADIVAGAEKLGISRGSTDRYLNRLRESGVIGCEYGCYWKKSGGY